MRSPTVNHGPPSPYQEVLQPRPGESTSALGAIISRIHDASGRLAGFVLDGETGRGYLDSGNRGRGRRCTAPRTDAGGRDSRPPTGGDPVRGSRSVIMLARRLSTADYFNLARRLVRVADQCVVEAGGLVGRHLGDGVTAFFPGSSRFRVSRSQSRDGGDSRRSGTRRPRSPNAADSHPKTPCCASDCIGARRSTSDSSRQSPDLKSPHSVMRSTRPPGSKPARPVAEPWHPRPSSNGSIERCKALGLERVNYTQVGELANATDKARRDAPAIAVCDV